ncbi:hypothetical protein Leryth_013290 [Lithospermum erythrorhizon]|nr:hypothetical protein Leryth_013290 [Lithospermum erythrorhizon]
MQWAAASSDLYRYHKDKFGLETVLLVRWPWLYRLPWSILSFRVLGIYCSDKIVGDLALDFCCVLLMKYEEKALQPYLDTSANQLVDHIEYRLSRRSIPKGPRFQADVPGWSFQTKEETLKNYDAESSRWLGTKVWEPEKNSQVYKNENTELDIDVTKKEACPVSYLIWLNAYIHLNDKRKELQRN